MMFSRLVQPHEGANGDGFLYERHFRTVSLSPVASWSLIGVLLVGLLLGTIAVYAARCSRRRARQVVMPLRESPPRRWAFSEAAAVTTSTVAAAAAVTTSTAAVSSTTTTATAAAATATAVTTGAAATATNEGARRCWCRNCANTVFLVEVPSPDACSLETVYSARSLLNSPVGVDPRRRPHGCDFSDSDLSSVSVQSIVFETTPSAWQLPQVVVTNATPPIVDSDAPSTAPSPPPPPPPSEANTLGVPDVLDRSLTYPPPPLPRPLDK